MPETLEQKKQLMPPVEKYCEFETKNGRFSENVVSKTERFTTAGSTSTWPKSGFTVASSVRFDVMLYLMSPPIRPVISCLLRNGSPTPGRANLLFETTYGMSSNWRGCSLSASPSMVPK